MACVAPMVAHRTRSRTKTGKFAMRFLCKATSFRGRWGRDLMLLPCRNCIGCRLEQSRQAAVRLVHECAFHPYSGFLTLTYDDDHLPKSWSLEPARWTKFAKDLRARFAFLNKGCLKFYAVGEYGDVSSRPHYHAIVYSDAPLLIDQVEPARGGSPQFTSPDVSAVWPEGRHRISEVTFESAAYCARYVLKKRNGSCYDRQYEWLDTDTGELHQLAREFVRWPKGLGKLHFDKWKFDVYPRDQVVLPGRGAFLPPPYYDRLLEREAPEYLAKIKLARQQKADIHISEAEWFGLVNEKHRTGKVQLLRQKDFCPRGVE